MKGKIWLSVLALVLILSSLGAGPAQAANLVQIHVGDVQAKYRPLFVGYEIQALVAVHGGSHEAVKGAVVTVELQQPSSVVVAQKATTDSLGLALFKFVVPSVGRYTICVTDLAQSTAVYNPKLNEKTCATVQIGASSPGPVSGG